MALEALSDKNVPPRSDAEESRSAEPTRAPRRSLALQLLGLIFYLGFSIVQVPRHTVAALRKSATSPWRRTAIGQAIGHVVVIGLGLIALWATPLVAEQLSDRALIEEHEYYSPPLSLRVGSAATLFPDVIERPLLLETKVVRRPRDDILAYEVRGNDTLVDIAVRNGISLDTLLWANDFAPDQLLYLGTRLRIPPIDGVIYTVAEDDALHEIAEVYQSNPVAIAEYNRIGLSTTLVEGMELIIPYGVLPEALRKTSADTQLSQREQPVAAFGEFRWPTQGIITQYYHGRHLALDIGNRVGTAIVAADAGQVVFAGWSPIGYGNRIVINHGNGWVTTYNHLSTFSVTVGDFVKAGETIGGMGNTGYSSGPHLHFEVLYNNRFRDPLSVLS